MREFVGLNDVVITKGHLQDDPIGHVCRLQSHWHLPCRRCYCSQPPTGSTGYSLSAGGPPIVNPAMNMLILTFICPHTLGARSFVVSPLDDVRIVLHAQSEEVMLTVDGQVGFRLEHQDEVAVRSAPEKTYLIKLGHRDFMKFLRHVLRRVRCNETEKI